MIALGLLGATAVALAKGAPWWLAAVALPAVLWAPGLGWARWLGRDGREGQPGTGLQQLIDACWIAMALAWLDVALIRELGLRDQSAVIGLLASTAAWSAAGSSLARRVPGRPRTPSRERIGAAAVVLAVLGTLAWRQADVVRPLDGHWYLEGAADDQPLVPVVPAEGWTEVEGMGWEEAGAWRLLPGAERGLLRAPDGATGRITLAARGPIGTRIQALHDGRVLASHRVDRAMVEQREEGLVRRYLEAGVAAISLDIDLEPGASIEVETDAPVVYLMASSEAVWALHATGELRYVHYYQLLNQVENQVWAEEVLTDRRFTWNQPPGWSPLLAVSALLVRPDLPGANLLFLQVLLLVGFTGVRAASLLAPGAHPVAWLVPAGLVASHGLLMFEPGSTNFPDSLYAAAVLGVVAALAGGRTAWFVAMGTAAQALRWPGAVVSTILAAAFWLKGDRALVRTALPRLWAVVLVGLLLAAGLSFTKEAEDLAFILYFETFPEHWHGESSPSALLPRAPGFYLLWLRYTGGGLALGALALLAQRGSARASAFAVMGAAFAYSLFLCTIDHHPTHYFLPLIALTGPAVVAASAARPEGWWRLGIPLVALAGLLVLLQGNRVW